MNSMLLEFSESLSPLSSSPLSFYSFGLKLSYYFEICCFIVRIRVKGNLRSVEKAPFGGISNYELVW